MGYRSELVIAVPLTVKTECLLTGNWPQLLAEENPVKVWKPDTEEHFQPVAHEIYEISGIKWYEGTYSEVDELIQFFQLYCDDCSFDREEDAECVAAIRLGEEMGDVEEWGEPSGYHIYINQSIDY